VTPISSDAAKPTILTISPDRGTTNGGTLVTVVGTFDRTATVTIAGIPVSSGWSPTFDKRFSSPPHAAGSVDIVVTNQDGTSETVVGAFTYIDPRSFDLEGTWGGFTDSEMWVEFTVSEHVLATVRCADEVFRPVEIPLSEPAANGKVEFVGDAGRFSVSMLTPSDAAGTIDLVPCWGGGRWQGTLVERKLQ